MATNAARTPIIRAVAHRSYSSKPQPISGVISDIKTTVLPNKLVVASADNGSAITRVSVVFKAGSRYESGDNQGVAHIMRLAAGLSTRSSSNFAITRNIQQTGANLTCIQGRETLAYTLEGTYDAVEKSSQYLSDIASQQCFKPWEVSELKPRLKLELHSIDPEVKALNFLHKVAFRTGLGNSLFCPKHKVGKISSETLQDYVANNFTTNNAAVVGLGVDHHQLVKYAENMCLESGGCTTKTSSKFHAGEIRSEKAGDLAYVAVGADGANLSNLKEAIAFAVLRRVMGVGPYIKRGSESSGFLAKAVGGAMQDHPFAISAVNAAYSDAGLFGFLLVAEAEHADKAVMAATKALKGSTISDADVRRAKNQLITSALLKSESGGSFIDLMGSQAALLGKVNTPPEITNAIEQITTADVAQAAAKVAKSKLAIASVGNIKNVPYLDQLK